MSVKIEPQFVDAQIKLFCRQIRFAEKKNLVCRENNWVCKEKN